MRITKPLRIAQLAHIIERVPPKKYGGSERVINVLTEGLIKRGHQVTLFATGDSLTSAKLISVVPKSLKETNGVDPYSPNAITSLHIGLAFKMQERFDIIHDHIGALSAPVANIAATPVITTVHGPFNEELQDLYSVLSKPYLVTISKGQLKNSSKINHIGTVYNGLNMENYPFSVNPGRYLLFVGRITYEKGVHFAVEIARRLDLPLIIAAKLETAFKPDIEYFEQKIKPFLSDKIQWIGEVTEEERNELMTNALCFLHPITWPEPFGLTLIEAMACGTPVVAFGLGSIPEIIVDSKTGYIVKTLDEMVTAVRNINRINRFDCREHVLNNFSGERMVKGYEQAYLQILSMQQTAQPVSFSMPILQPPSPGIIRSSTPERVYDMSYAHDVRSYGNKFSSNLKNKK